MLVAIDRTVIAQNMERGVPRTLATNKLPKGDSRRTMHGRALLTIDNYLRTLAESQTTSGTSTQAHCVNSNKKKFKTEATAFLRDIVQHLPENPMQVPGSRSSIMANLVSGAPGNFSAPTPSTPGLGRVPHQGHPSSVESLCAHQARALAFALSDQHALPPPLSATPSPFSAGGHRITMTVGNPPLPIVNLQAAHQAHDQALAELYALPRPPLFPATPSTPSPGGHRIVMSAGTPSLSTPDLLAIPHSQKRAGEDAWGGFPQFHSSPGYSPASCNNTPEPSSHTCYISTPHNRPSYLSFVLGPPETPSPRKSAQKSPGAAYLSGNYRARRSLPQRFPARPSALPSGLDEIPRFLEGL